MDLDKNYKPKRITEMDRLQCQSVIALGLLLTSVFVSIVIILILPDFDRIDGRTEVCVQLQDSIKCGRTEDTLHQYLDSVRVEYILFTVNILKRYFKKEIGKCT